MRENEQGEIQTIREESSKDVFVNAISTHGEVMPIHRRAYLNRSPPYQHFHHFVQKRKPWVNENLSRNPPQHVDNPTNPDELWFNTLREIEKEYKFGINTANVWSGYPTLGSFPASSMVLWAKNKREEIKSSTSNHDNSVR